MKLVKIPQRAIKFHVPLVQQPNDYKCGLAVIAAIIAEYGLGPLADIEDGLEQLASLLETSQDYGTYYGNIANYLNTLGPLEATVRQHVTEGELVGLIDQGKSPYRARVILSMQAYPADRDVSHFEDPNFNDAGHYILAVGYHLKYRLLRQFKRYAAAVFSICTTGKWKIPSLDNHNEDIFFFVDPCKVGRYGCLSWKDLNKRWHEAEGIGATELSDHLTIIVKLKRPGFPAIYAGEID